MLNASRRLFTTLFMKGTKDKFIIAIILVADVDL